MQFLCHLYSAKMDFTDTDLIGNSLMVVLLFELNALVQFKDLTYEKNGH